ncbi:MAG: efflux transporter outer membrane subunit [Thiotrichales bacterium]
MRAPTLFLALSLAVAAVGCVTRDAPRAAVPAPAMPDTWRGSSAPVSLSPPAAWLGDLGDPGLTALVREALAANPGIEAALARVAAGRARADIAGAGELPNAALNLRTARGQRLVNGLELTGNNFELNLGASWELDLWQRLAARTRAAVADAVALERDWQASRLILAADVAVAWYGAAEARLQTQLAEQRVSSFRDTLDVITERYREGLVEALDVRLARENLATAEAGLNAERRAFDAARRGLEVLLGRYPAGELAVLADLPEPSRAVPAGLPSTLLDRRPDILAAALRVDASAARSTDASRNRLPGFALTANGGTASTRLRDLLDWDNLVWSLAASIAQPLFQGGRLKAEETLARANDREALANYARTVLTAFREVETTLAAEPLLEAQVASQSEAALEASAAATLALERYRAGLTEIITLLDTQRRAFNTESARIETRLRRLQNRIELYRALGGDFDDAPTPTAEPST